jgi:hypothetical protein
MNRHDCIEDAILDALNSIGEPQSKDESLCRTKLQEAIFWIKMARSGNKRYDFHEDFLNIGRD